MKDTIFKPKKAKVDTPVTSGVLLSAEVTQPVADNKPLWKQYQLETDAYNFYLKIKE